jgi:hypothetical protein
MGTVFTEAAPGQVAIADKSGAYLLRRNGTSRWDAERLNLEPGPIWSVIAMPGGALWYGCGLDLCRYEGGKTTHMGAALHLPATQWMHLLLTLDGHVWIRGDSNIGEIIPGEGRYVAHPPSRPLEDRTIRRAGCRWKGPYCRIAWSFTWPVGERQVAHGHAGQWLDQLRYLVAFYGP